MHRLAGGLTAAAVDHVEREENCHLPNLRPAFSSSINPIQQPLAQLLGQLQRRRKHARMQSDTRSTVNPLKIHPTASQACYWLTEDLCRRR